MALKSVKFTVIITFDITVDGRTAVYARVTELLANNGYVKESPSGKNSLRTFITALLNDP